MVLTWNGQTATWVDAVTFVGIGIGMYFTFANPFAAAVKAAAGG